MIKGSKAVLDFFQQVNEGHNRQIYFAIYKKGQESSGNPCIKSPNTEGWNYAMAFSFLQRWLTLQSYGDFVLIVNEKEKVAERGGIRHDFSISIQDTQPAAVAGPPPPSAAEIDQMVTARVEGILSAKEKEKELKDLQAKVIELTKENKTLARKATEPWTVLVTELRPYIGDLLVEAGVLKHKVAGTPQSNARPVDDDNVAEAEVVNDDKETPDPLLQGRVEAVIKKFVIARPDDWLEVLEMLAGAVEKNPSLADKVKLFL